MLGNSHTVLVDTSLCNKPFSRGGVGVEVLEVFWEELWLHFFWPTFWLHCILYFTYRGVWYGTKCNVGRKLAKGDGAIIPLRKHLELPPLPLLYKKVY